MLVANGIEYWSNYSIRFEISNIRTALQINWLFQVFQVGGHSEHSIRQHRPCEDCILTQIWSVARESRKTSLAEKFLPTAKQTLTNISQISLYTWSQCYTSVVKYHWILDLSATHLWSSITGYLISVLHICGQVSLDTWLQMCNISVLFAFHWHLFEDCLLSFTSHKIILTASLLYIFVVLNLPDHFLFLKQPGQSQTCRLLHWSLQATCTCMLSLILNHHQTTESKTKWTLSPYHATNYTVQLCTHTVVSLDTWSQCYTSVLLSFINFTCRIFLKTWKQI